MSISSWGECYVVCCPFCTDTRYRLVISHHWAVDDCETGNDLMHLCYCHNEQCTSTREYQLRLHGKVFPHGAYADRVTAIDIAPAPAPQAPPPITLPPDFVTLDKLPPTHPANGYLAGRGYEPERLGRIYRVGYCQTHPVHPLASGRIIAPVYQDGRLAGWQARYVGELDWKAAGAPPKWWTCPGMHKSKLLYNGDAARKFRTGVLVEGPGDVWGFGSMACAIFGSSASAAQESLLFAAFRDGSLVVLLDPDVQADPLKKPKYDAMVDRLRRAGCRGGVASVVLPAGYDPGSLDRDWMHKFVERKALAQGVRVDWSQKA